MERSRRNIIGAVCLALTVVASACSGSGGSDVDRADVMTDEVTDEVTTTVALRPVDADDLAGLLPEAADIGAGFVVVANASAPSEAEGAEDWDAAMQEACPDLTRVASDPAEVITVALSAAPSTASREFVDPYLRSVAVLVTTDDDLFPMRDRVDALIVAINKCDTIRVTDPATGIETSLKLQANPDSNYGDVGLVMSMDVAATGGGLRGKARMTGNLRAFQYGAVTAAITTVDGYDPVTLRTVRVDADLSPELAKRLNREIRELQDN